MQAALLSAAVVVLLAGRAAWAADPYKATAGPYAVATLETQWKDGARDVVVPVKVYYPKTVAEIKEPLPLIVFSHGLGGSREGYRIWGEHWASQGYMVVHPTHVGSDTSVVAGGLTGMAAAINTQTAARRVQDVHFILDTLEKINGGLLPTAAPATGPATGAASAPATAAAPDPMAAFKGKVDMKHIGMAGHSFGAQTTMQIAGQQLKLGQFQQSNVDARVMAAVAMSAQGATVGSQKDAFGAIKIPVLFLTGTNDDNPGGLGNVKAADRRIPFDNDPFPETYLVIFKGAVHMTFAPTADGLTLGSRLTALRDPGANTPEEEAKIHTLIKESTTAFWDAYLRGDAKAKAWLESDFAKVMGAAGTYETKRKGMKNDA